MAGSRVPDLYSVAALSATDVWAVGSRGGFEHGSKPEAAHWDGHKLRLMKPFAGSSGHGKLDAVAAIASDDVWAVGTDGWVLGRPVVVHWDGRSWKVAPTPPLPKDASLSSIAAVGADDVWAVGGTFGNSYQPLVMHWDGQRWTVVDVNSVAPNWSSLTAIAGSSSSDVWAVGEQNDDAPDLAGIEPLLLHWDGQAWAKVDPPADDEFAHRVTSVDALSQQDAWFVFTATAEDAQPDAIRHWRGQAVNSYTYPDWDAPGRFDLRGNGGWGDVAATSPTDVWAAGYRYRTDYEHSHPLLAHWDGGGWGMSRTPLKNLTATMSSLSAVSTREVWAAGGGPTSDNGTLGTGVLARYAC